MNNLVLCGKLSFETFKTKLIFSEEVAACLVSAFFLVPVPDQALISCLDWCDSALTVLPVSTLSNPQYYLNII